MATTFPLVLDRMSTLCASAPFSLARAREPFSFDLQPDGRLDDVFRVEGELDETAGYLGGDREELWTVRVWVAQKVKHDASAAYREACVLVDSLTAAVAAAETAGDFHVGEEQAAEIQLPADDLEYLVAQVTLPLSLERTL